MKKAISVLALTSILAAGSAMASGWRIPEQSVDSTAKAGANIASSSRADAAYFNPANMAWLSDTFHAQLDATYLYLSAIEYDDARNAFFDGESEEEHFLLPTGFIVSPSYGGARFGLAITEPFGLSKRWKDPYERAVAEEFSLTVIEVNPTVSYSFGKMVSIAAGPRMLYADATVKSDASGLGTPLSRNLEDDIVEWGWNAAISVKPIEKLNISATYRSNVDLDFEDESAELNILGRRLTTMSMSAFRHRRCSPFRLPTMCSPTSMLNLPGIGPSGPSMRLLISISPQLSPAIPLSLRRREIGMIPMPSASA